MTLTSLECKVFFWKCVLTFLIYLRISSNHICTEARSVLISLHITEDPLNNLSPMYHRALFSQHILHTPLFSLSSLCCRFLCLLRPKCYTTMTTAAGASWICVCDMDPEAELFIPPATELAVGPEHWADARTLPRKWRLTWRRMKGKRVLWDLLKFKRKEIIYTWDRFLFFFFNLPLMCQVLTVQTQTVIMTH